MRKEERGRGEAKEGVDPVKEDKRDERKEQRMTAKKEEKKINVESRENERREGRKSGGKKTEETSRIKKEGIVEDRVTEAQNQVFSFL